MAEHSGWRSFWWLNVALMSLTLLAVIFMFPETKWDSVRREKFHDSNKTHPDLAVDGTEKVENGADTNLKTTSGNTNAAGSDMNGSTVIDPYLGKGKPSRAQWRIYQPNSSPFRSIFLDLWIPWKLFVFPIVEFASFVVSWSCSSFLTINLTQSQAFAAPPYNFSSQNIGLKPQRICLI
jgi:hypothetical protein